MIFYFGLIYIYTLEIKEAISLIELDFSSVALIHETDKEFLSFTIDSHQLLEHWVSVNLRNESLINMTKQLTPAFLRVGGTDADDITFDPVTPKHYGFYRDYNTIQDDNEICQTKTVKPPKKYTIYGDDILLLKEFIEKTGTELIYDLNALQRTSDWEWNVTNSKELLEFMSQHDINVKGWELGNEPDHFRHVFNVTISPHRHADDFTILKQLLGEFKKYNESLVIGPDTTNSKVSSANYLKKFLRHIKPEILSKVTFHQYFFEGRTATVNDFMNVTIMNTLKHEIRIAKRIVRKLSSNTTLWIGETSSGWGGGCPHISNKFAESFMWLDKLGLAAKEGIDVVIRQTLLSRWYGLITPDGQPTPDYFVSVMHKRLVGRYVIGNLGVTKRNASNVDNRKGRLPKSIRLYTQCTTKSNGAAVIFGINVGEKSYQIHVKGLEGNLIEEYLITAPKNHLLSRYVQLNGNIMKLDNNNQLPQLSPVKKHKIFTFPSNSIGFWVLPNADIDICYKN